MVLDLFSGIGGFSLGLEATGMTTIAFCEIEPFCCAVLKKHWPDVPIFGDIRQLTKESYAKVMSDARLLRPPEYEKQTTGFEQCGEVVADTESGESGKQAESEGREDTCGRSEESIITDTKNTISYPELICGGFPCQPFSVAGKRRGTEDNRHLWPEMFRIIKEFRPRWVIGENVAGFVKMALDDCLSDLESIGYDCQPFIIPACAVNAPHRRDRVWIVAHTNQFDGNGGGLYSGKIPQFQEAELPRSEVDTNQQGKGLEGSIAEGDTRTTGLSAELCQDVADAEIGRCERRGQNEVGERGEVANGIKGSGEYRTESDNWSIESRLGRVVNELPHSMDSSYWLQEPEGVPRVAKGIENRVNRLKALGNAVVPTVVYEIGRAIMEVENDTGTNRVG